MLLFRDMPLDDDEEMQLGATLGNGGWATLINSAKGPLLINGQPPIPPPSIPEERLNLPLPPLPPG